MKFFVHNNLYYWYMYIDHTANAILIWSIEGEKRYENLEASVVARILKKKWNFIAFGLLFHKLQTFH